MLDTQVCVIVLKWYGGFYASMKVLSSSRVQRLKSCFLLPAVMCQEYKGSLNWTETKQNVRNLYTMVWNITMNTKVTVNGIFQEAFTSQRTVERRNACICGNTPSFLWVLALCVTQNRLSNSSVTGRRSKCSESHYQFKLPLSNFELRDLGLYQITRTVHNNIQNISTWFLKYTKMTSG